MFRALICPFSGVCDCVVELPHWPIVLRLLCVGIRARFGKVGIRASGRRGYYLENIQHNKTSVQNTGLFEMIVRLLTARHTQ